MRDGDRVIDRPAELAGAFLWRAPADLAAKRWEWLTMRKPSKTNCQIELQESKTEDKPSGLDIEHNQGIRTITIGRIVGRNLARKHATVSLRMLFKV